jgi:hypothetical protein
MEKMHIEFCLESLKGKDHKEDLGVEGGNIKIDHREEYGADSSDSGQGPVTGSCEDVNEPFGSIKGRLTSWLAECTTSFSRKIDLWN